MFNYHKIFKDNLIIQEIKEIKNIIENSEYLKKDLNNPLKHEELKHLKFLEYEVVVTGYIHEDFEGSSLREVRKMYIADQEIPKENLFEILEKDYDFETIVNQEICDIKITSNVSYNSTFLEIRENKIITRQSYYRFQNKNKDWKLKKIKTESEKMIERLKTENLVLNFGNFNLYYNAGVFLLTDTIISEEKALKLIEKENFKKSTLKKVRVDGCVILGGGSLKWV